MDFTLNSTLRRSTLISVTVTLWTEDDIQASIASDNGKILMEHNTEEYMKGCRYAPGTFKDIDSAFYYEEARETGVAFCKINFRRRSIWQALEDKVKAKVAKLPLPHTLKKLIEDVVQPIGLEILNWGLRHQRYFGIFLGDCFSKLRWTPQGTVDEKQTAEMLIRDEDLDITLRYRLACFYCLEDHISDLWRQLNAKSFHEKNLKEIKRHELGLVTFWSHYLEGELLQMIDIFSYPSERYYTYLFERVACVGNLSATIYFLQKLSFKVSEQDLLHVTDVVACKAAVNRQIPKKCFTDVLCVVLSIMDSKQQFKVLSSRFLQFSITCFLDWPWQDKFTEIFQYIQNSLEPCAFFHIALRVCEKIKEGYTAFDYCNLVMFWHQSSSDHKKFAIEHLSYLFMAESDDNIKLLLQQLTAEEEKKVIFGDGNASGEVMHKLCFLRLIVSKCVASKDDVILFKNVFLTYLKNREGIDAKLVNGRNKWDKLFNFWMTLF